MVVFYITFSCLALLGLLPMLHGGHFLKLLTLTVLSGTAALLAVNCVGSFFAVHLPLNVYTFSFCAVGGVPAVLALLLLQTMFCLL